MRLPLKPAHIAPRLMTGAFILNSGLSKRRALEDEQTAQGVHGMASTAYPFLGRMQPATFLRLLSAAEIGLGAALLLPVVPTAVAGAGLTAFGGALVGLYLRTPGMRKEHSIAPTEQGLAFAKDSWMLGIGLGFLADACTSARGHRCGHRCRHGHTGFGHTGHGHTCHGRRVH